MSENLFLFSPRRENNGTLFNNNIHILEDALELTCGWEIGGIQDYDIHRFLSKRYTWEKNIVYFNTDVCTIAETGDIAFNDAAGNDLNRISEYFFSS
ncbi:hypothetical protein IM793_16780 [Pedobacter sp. MR2016-19]|uniref:hypothetical protein n=1 Tax=Pedobacter sp. MR2016-19 TaxID=2780089 RepID=UPI00187545D5|nr:hypothetical protein [Pedobacter sp. MR2016-19]MBE5320827.1 hypothetical protein [Pedobacter sp. MR2016-19]